MYLYNLSKIKSDFTVLKDSFSLSHLKTNDCSPVTKV